MIRIRMIFDVDELRRDDIGKTRRVGFESFDFEPARRQFIGNGTSIEVFCFDEIL